LTAFSGIIGAVFALAYSSAEKAGDATCWILPFTSGGFLYIALANIVPEILAEKSPVQSVKQLASFYLGISIIYILKVFFD
jgi:zinc transporter 13